MFTGITGPRLMSMVSQEQRWTHNLKKAFYESDVAYAGERRTEDAFPALCKAVDVAQTLRRSLQTPASNWTAPDSRNNRVNYISFLHSEIPDPSRSGVDILLTDVRTNRAARYSFGELFYAIRCMIHENENLNEDEHPDYHVALDWNIQDQRCFGRISAGRLVCNAPVIWWRVRQVLAKFILGTEMMMAIERRDKFVLDINPPLKSIHADDGRHSILPRAR
jgi:hypothetical protein